MSLFADNLQVKQRMGQISMGKAHVAVYISGDPRYYVFRQLCEASRGTFVETGLEWPVLGRNLKRGWRRELY